MFLNKGVLAVFVLVVSLFGSSTALAARQQGEPVALAVAPVATIPLCQALDVLSGYKSHRSTGAHEQYMGLIYVVSSSRHCVFSIPFDPAIISLKNSAGTLQPVFDAVTARYSYAVGAYQLYTYVLLVPHTVRSNQANNRCPFPAFC